MTIIAETPDIPAIISIHEVTNIYECTHTRTHIWGHTHTYTYTYTHTHIHIHTKAQMHLYL
ncbi:hypothetical protein LOAG_17293 [Loa loa]|uniref:Uncharacterized protein n=1 Tax=Loa loa TaxID=7209 RepID=A0A1S0UJN7_LOALO|nr:hypothetical protein LOAG_17293 [Loa loa]EJD75578.1 hypothetical protein LOAG_17293 [Loa loa]